MPTPGQSHPPMIRINTSINHTSQISIQDITNNIINRNSKETYTVFTEWYATPTGRDVVPQNITNMYRKNNICGPDITITHGR